MLDWATSNIRNSVLLPYIVLPASQTPFGRRDWPFNSAIAYAHSLVPRSSLAVMMKFARISYCMQAYRLRMRKAWDTAHAYRLSNIVSLAQTAPAEA